MNHNHKDNKYNKLVEDMLMEFRIGKGEYLHIFHYGRLIAEGFSEIDAAEMIVSTALVMETGYEKGLRLSPQQVEGIYEGLPGTKPSNVLRNILERQ
jgi:hypothetical protein